MSLLAGRQSAAVLRIARTFKPTQFSHNISTDTPATVEKKQQPGPVAVQPVRDVMVADVISGAPGVFDITFPCFKISIPSQLNFATVLFAYTNPPETLCNLVLANRNVGV